MALTTTLVVPVTGVNSQNKEPFTASVTVAAQYDAPTAGSTAQAVSISYVGVPPQGAAVDGSSLVVTVANPANGNPATPTSDPISPPMQIVKKETNAGLVAGVAVGCLLAGALIGFVVALFLYRRRQQKQHGTYIVSSSTVEPKGHHAPPAQVPVPKDSGINLDKFLLDAAPDQEIAGELHSLGSLIQQHVENNYHLYPINVDPRELAVALSQLGVVEGSLSAEALATLALEPQTRHVALQHVISRVLFSSVDVGSRSRLSMLPAPVAAFLQSVAPAEPGRSNEEASSLALNQWRVLSTFLLHPSRSQRTSLPLSDGAVASQAAGLASALDTFLGYFVSGDSGQQKAHLQAVIAEIAKLGYVLLSQPSEWRFVHDAGVGGGRNGVAVVCAGLVKVTSRDGTRYPTPQQVVAPVVVQV